MGGTILRSVCSEASVKASAKASLRTLKPPGQSGILGEHDITDRTLRTGTPASFPQTASYVQLFWAVREWLVPSLIIERLRVESPYRESLNALKLDVNARLSGQVTLGIGPRIQRDELTGRVTAALVLKPAAGVSGASFWADETAWPRRALSVQTATLRTPPGCRRYLGSPIYQ